MLPDMPGTAVCQGSSGASRDPARADHHGHRKAEEIDRIVGFELGADDYVVKPFSVRELMLRIDAVLRRGKVSERRVVEVAELRIDKDAHRVTSAARRSRSPRSSSSCS